MHINHSHTLTPYYLSTPLCQQYSHFHIHLDLYHIEFNKGKPGEMAQPLKPRLTG